MTSVLVGWGSGGRGAGCCGCWWVAWSCRAWVLLGWGLAGFAVTLRGASLRSVVSLCCSVPALVTVVAVDPDSGAWARRVGGPCRIRVGGVAGGRPRSGTASTGCSLWGLSQVSRPGGSSSALPYSPHPSDLAFPPMSPAHRREPQRQQGAPLTVWSLSGKGRPAGRGVRAVRLTSGARLWGDSVGREAMLLTWERRAPSESR